MEVPQGRRLNFWWLEKFADARCPPCHAPCEKKKKVATAHIVQRRCGKKWAKVSRSHNEQTPLTDPNGRFLGVCFFHFSRNSSKISPWCLSQSVTSPGSTEGGLGIVLDSSASSCFFHSSIFFASCCFALRIMQPTCGMWWRLKILGLSSIVQNLAYFPYKKNLHHHRCCCASAEKDATPRHKQHSNNPVEQPRKDLNWSSLILPSKKCSHQDKETIRLVIATLSSIPNLRILPRSVGSWTPNSKDIQFLQLMHGSWKETSCNEHQQDGGTTHEPVNANLLSALEKATANQSGQDQSTDNGNW